MKVKIRLWVPSLSLDWLLLTAIIVLVVVLLWPVIETWQNRPRPGAQVCQKYVGKKAGNDVQIDYLLYLPSEYDPGRKWPLVVFLHGAGARGCDLRLVRQEGLSRLVDCGERFDFILVSPQCPEGSSWSPKLVVELTEHVSNSFSVDRDRAYLTGYSMGGFGTWETACYDPNRFAAIAPVAGGGDVVQARKLQDLPIWAFHGKLDRTVPLEASQRMVNAVRKCGGHVEFTVYPRYGHGICDLPYQDGRFYAWLLAQRRKQEPRLSIQENGSHRK
jgi:predicted peptidase